MINQLYPCLWFENQAQEAAEFYCGIFPNSKILNESPMAVNVELNGKHFMLLNDRRPPHEFNESISFVITCKNQKEIDYYWDKLIADGGEENICGWCSDKFGVSWQVIPSILGKLMSNPKKTEKVVKAFMKMQKFDIEKLKKASL
jgi:predicted 3-demethylubiquinone-9 3-methyltransferase (glyoxalase superfamily)